jgi:hypothetical protein
MTQTSPPAHVGGQSLRESKLSIIASEEGSEEGSDDCSGTEDGTEDVIEVELCDELGEVHDDLLNDSDY